MNAMSFKSFVRKYILDLSDSKKFSVSKLFNESKNNRRLVDPLELYCALEDRKLKSPELNDHQKLIDDLKKNGFDYELYTDKSYVKIHDAYLNYLNKNKYDCVTKSFIRNRILKLQKSLDISNYRIYTDLKLNPGNTNAFLKNCDMKKLSLKDAQNILSYLLGLQKKK